MRTRCTMASGIPGTVSLPLGSWTDMDMPLGTLSLLDSLDFSGVAGRDAQEGLVPVGFSPVRDPRR